MKKRIMALVMAAALIVTMMPVTPYAASKKNNSIKTYVFFGSDSRRNDDLWKSKNGGKITTDRSSHEGSIPKSDVIMLLRVDNKNKTVDIVSVYRDTLLDVSGKGKKYNKINNAYSELGPKKAAKALGKSLNIKIDGYVAANFKATAEVIDSLGGVTVKIEKDKVAADKRTKSRKTVPDVMNEYINEMDRVYGTETPHITKTGKQKLSGLQAVAYARVRYTEGGDFRRSVRQRTVVTSMAKKYKAASTKKKAKVVLAVMNNVDTNIPVSVFRKAAKYKIKKKVGFPYYKAGCAMKTQGEVVVPCDLETNVIKLHKSVYKQKKYKANKTVKKYSKKIKKLSKLNYSSRSSVLDNRY